jgi:hypothetical protein
MNAVFMFISRWKANIETKRLWASYGPIKVTFRGNFEKNNTIQYSLLN